MERTLVLIKPEVVKEDRFHEVMKRYEGHGFKITRVRIARWDDQRAGAFYLEHQGKPFFPGLIEHMTSGPLVAMMIEGEDVVARVRRFNGATNPSEAEVGTVRREFGRPGPGPANAVHGSASIEEAERELQFIFGPLA